VVLLSAKYATAVGAEFRLQPATPQMGHLVQTDSSKHVTEFTLTSKALCTCMPAKAAVQAQE
jgi:hypothetical protein